MSELEDLQKLRKSLQQLAERQRFNHMAFFTPYPKQREFIANGAWARERLLMAGNQVGKSETGAYEAAMHMTGLYPDDWPGRRFDRPTRGWVAGVTGLVVRDVQQKKLCGTPGVDLDFGTGMIPKHLFVDKPTLSRGVADAFDMIQVKHVSGGTSVALFKSYEQGRTKFQGDGIDWGWGDEEPEEDVYAEFLTRTTATGGMLYLTFTPLFGRSKVVTRFLDEFSPARAVTTMTIEDAEHIPVEKRAEIISAYLDYEREARANGVPMLGSGAVFQIPESMITEPTLEYIPPHWVKIWGIDFGIDHPFAACLLLWDRDNDVIHVHHCFRMSGTGSTITPLNHAYAMKQYAAAVPVAWPHDGNNRSPGSGEALAAIYRKEKLVMLAEHATHAAGGNSLEAGIQEMRQRMVTGRWKVGAHCSEWLEEYRMYHRKNGLIVKERDDVLSASRYGMMMRRYARSVPLGPAGAKRHDSRPQVADGTSLEHWGLDNQPAFGQM